MKGDSAKDILSRARKFQKKLDHLHRRAKKLQGDARSPAGALGAGAAAVYLVNEAFTAAEKFIDWYYERSAK